ncbi:MAG: hypothetical protein ACYTFG_05320, partial [Planctomycetota bacterium]
MILLTFTLLGVVNCAREETTVIRYDRVPALSGNFAGTPVGAHNLASDGTAFSAPLQDLQAFRVFVNERNGEAILLFTTLGGGITSLWVSGFDGNLFKPPVAITGTGYDPTGTVNLDSACVHFINGWGGREGDAVLVFRRPVQTAPPAERLYSAYFDRSLLNVPVASTDPSIRHGFDTTADLVDASSGQDVESYGLVSDGFRGTVRYVPGTSSSKSSDDTSFLWAVWTRESGSGRRLYGANFDLSQVNSQNGFSPEAVVSGDLAFSPGDQVEPGIVAHDSLMFFRYTPATGSGTRLNAARFSAGSWGDGFLLNRADTDGGDSVNADLPQDGSVFGPDEGLDRTYVFFTETGFDGVGPSDGTVNGDTDLVCAMIDPALSPPAAELAEIDGETSNVFANPVGDVECRISRDGSWIGATWIQDHDSNAMLTTPSLMMQGIQTISAGQAARTLADSLLPAPERLNFGINTAIRSNGVITFEFQERLGFGESGQLDPSVMHLAWISLAHTPTDGDNMALHVSSVRFLESVSPVAPPSLAPGSGQASDTVVWEEDQDWGWAAKVAGGDRFYLLLENSFGSEAVYFVGQGSTPLTGGGPPFESRLFFWERRSPAMSSPIEISGDCALSGQSTLGFLNSRGVRGFDVAAVPPPSVGIPGSAHHIYLVEEEDAPGSAVTLRSRVFDPASA